MGNEPSNCGHSVCGHNTVALNTQTHQESMFWPDF